MKERGIDISKHPSDYLDKNIDIVITVCDNVNNAFSTFPKNATRIHWSIADPFRNWNFDLNQLSIFRKTRDKIKARVLNFMEE